MTMLVEVLSLIFRVLFATLAVVPLGWIYELSLDDTDCILALGIAIALLEAIYARIRASSFRDYLSELFDRGGHTFWFLFTWMSVRLQPLLRGEIFSAHRPGACLFEIFGRPSSGGGTT
jgi:hypothetical protein